MKAELKAANPSKNFKMKKTCDVCQHVFDVTLDNVKIESYEKYKDVDWTNLNWFTGKTLRKESYEIINIYYTICPNCGHQEQLFYVPTGKTTEKSKTIYLD